MRLLRNEDISAYQETGGMHQKKQKQEAGEEAKDSRQPFCKININTSSGQILSSDFPKMSTISEYQCLVCKDMKVVPNERRDRLTNCSACSPAKPEPAKKIVIGRKKMNQRMRAKADFIRWNLRTKEDDEWY